MPRGIHMRGRKMPEYVKKKISEHHKKTGVGKWMKGKSRTLESRKKQGNSVRGVKNYRWKGGYQRKLWHNNRRRIIKHGNGGFHTLKEWENLKAQYNYTCPCCKKREPTIKLSRDHIIPLTKGGSDNIENVQPLCRSCNSAKNNYYSIKY